LKEEALYCTVWRTCFGRDCGPVIWQTAWRWVVIWCGTCSRPGFAVMDLQIQKEPNNHQSQLKNNTKFQTTFQNMCTLNCVYFV